MQNQALSQDLYDELITLAKSEAISSVLDIAGVNYTVIDINGNYVFQNGTTLVLIHQAANQKINAAEVDQASWENCQDVMKSGQRTIKEEQFEGKYLLSIKQPIISNGKCLGILVLSIDITDRKKSEQAKHAFLRNMGHDIRTPLVGIYSLAMHMQSEEQDESKRELLTYIVHSSERLSSLLEQVLEVSELGAIPMNHAPYNVAVMVAEVVNLMQAAIIAKKLQLIIDCPQATIELDKFRVSRILLSMLSNAVKFTEQGTIKISVEVQPNLKIIVEDTGVGIAEEKINSIFEPFSKLQQSGEHQCYMGAGTGLYIAKQFAEELNGKIKVISKVISKAEKGSIFIFQINN